jgi:hypothetical protein
MGAAQDAESTLTEQLSDTPPTNGGPEAGYAPVNGLHMYYEIHGSGGVPLLLLHGGLFNIDLQFGEVLPALAKTRQVIAVDFQAWTHRRHRAPSDQCLPGV